MIVNYVENGWEIITQRAHGLLAAEICLHWKKDKQPARWLETLIATAEHDDVYNEFENEDLLTEQGGPRDFKMTSFDRGDAERLMKMASTKSAYIALLISRHIQFVHGEDAAARAFCELLKTCEKKWLSAAGCTLREIEKSYSLLEFCDAFSLLICQQLIQPEQRSIEISDGPDKKNYHMHATGENCVTVNPWPFEVDAFEVRYESRQLKQLMFSNIAEFRAIIDQVKPENRILKISRRADSL
jgi:hypothetical protein